MVYTDIKYYFLKIGHGIHRYKIAHFKNRTWYTQI